jgi:hypothetical protein
VTELRASQHRPSPPSFFSPWHVTQLPSGSRLSSCPWPALRRGLQVTVPTLGCALTAGSPWLAAPNGLAPCTGPHLQARGAGQLAAWTASGQDRAFLQMLINGRTQGELVRNHTGSVFDDQEIPNSTRPPLQVDQRPLDR